jgi:hypothetical protein
MAICIFCMADRKTIFGKEPGRRNKELGGN